ncbi:hypothetical protein A5844_000403 [Enterococcus sp. 10A9_DIV0425]|uniref:Probable peptidoglycan glycosyltransferase FtsW n=1 Tax=Candidatus Enterococcus wittei TaxID=1987383 RepID=A0A2C9XR40_9ENTE|nr:FtsW/RodA/SpoVE family cell cycle protein [Enterococcus sp. 10A9_DIV0425]OTP12187.1 hypothetical protein A5844_000403 [Enterococcus sp. 10A9_DIV0425]THE16159.1 FtsW/RodA/SpoVE family cell cycle protein [Enterococcus hirae]
MRVDKRKKLDLFLIVPYVVVSVIGLLMVYSASTFRLMTFNQQTTYLLVRQFIFVLVSWGGICLIFKIRSSLLLHPTLVKIILSIGIGSLMMTRIPGIGVNVSGAQRWVSLLGFQFQPAEIVNVGLILYFAYYFRKYRSVSSELKKPILITSVCFLLILFQPKVAGAILLLLLATVMITSIQLPVRNMIVFFLGLIGLLLITGGVIYVLGKNGWLPRIFSHTFDRLNIASNPFLDPYGKGFQMSQSYYAIYNGGLFGLGLGNSITKKGYLPVAETDFIFSIILEELGLIVGLFLLALLFLIILRLFVLSMNEPNQQIGLIYLGTGTLLLIQTSINIASISGIIPMTGMPLPFISYGGSSYLILSMLLGICLKLSSRGSVYEN